MRKKQRKWNFNKVDRILLGRVHWSPKRKRKITSMDIVLVFSLLPLEAISIPSEIIFLITFIIFLIRFLMISRENIDVVLVTILLILNRFYTSFSCFYCWLSTDKWDKIFKSEPSKICGRQPLKKLKE